MAHVHTHKHTHTYTCEYESASSLMLQILSHCERITDEGVRHLVTGASVVEGLQELEIDNCPNISDVTLDVVRYVHMYGFIFV